MSFEPDTSDIQLRQLREEIAKIREEQFTNSLPTNNIGSPTGFASTSGIPSPPTGVTHVYPRTVNITKDTGVIDLLKYDALVTDFVIGETITGFISGATAEIGDIDLTTSTTGTLTLVPDSLTGSFDDDENITGNVAGDADADGDEFTQTGRGHLNAGAGSIIVNADQVSTPFEIHFIDGANQDGQTMYIRAIEGQTIRLRRAVTNDGNTGNLDLDESFDIVENALVFFQFQIASNATDDNGGWVPLLSNVTAGASVGTSIFEFPILYPKENLGTLNGVIDLSLNQSDGHYKQITLDGDASLTFSNLPPSINGFKFYVLTIQDGTGGHVYTDLPNTVLFESSLLSQLQTGAGAQTLWQFSTADGGTNWHSAVINPQGQQDTPWQVDHDANSFDLFNIDKLRFLGAGGFSFPTDNSVQGISTSGDGLQFNVPLSQSYRFYIGGDDVAEGGEFFTMRAQGANIGFDFHDKALHNVGIINFTETSSPLFTSAIFPFTADKQLQYLTQGDGSHHAFFANNISNPSFEIREDVVKSNVDFNMVTNNIFNIDQAQFDESGGFDSVTDKDIRTITGGAEGIVMNIPKISPFAGGLQIYFENSAETESEKQYGFEIGQLRMFRNEVTDTLGIFFSNGGSIADLNSHIQFNGGVNSNAIDPQTIKWAVKDSGFTTIDMFEISGTEHNTTNGGGFKLFTDINMQTQDINNVDRVHFNSNNGITGGNQVVISGFQDDMQFNVPLNQEFTWKVNIEDVAKITSGQFRMLSNSEVINPSITTDGSFIIGLESPSSPFIDGEFRLVNNLGSQDVEVFTGGQVVNLSEVGSQTPWLSDIDANTFNLINLDTLKYTPSGASGHDGVIGFGEYGSAVDPSGFLKWSVPSGESYEWQINLDRILTLNTATLHMEANASIFNPTIIVDGAFIVGTVHTAGTGGITDGEQRLVTGTGGSDVVFGSGGNIINLSTLGAGGGDNLGNHIMTQALDNNGFSHSNFVGWVADVGQAFDVGGSGATWNLNSGDEYIFRLGGSNQLRVNLGEIQIFNNVLSWENSSDFIVHDGDGFILNSQTSTDEFKFKSGGIDRFLVNNTLINVFDKPFSNFVGWTGGVGQGLTVSGSGLLWDIDSSDTYEFRAGGSSVFTVSGVGSAFNGGNLNLSSNKIVGVADPTDALDAVNLQTLQAQGGGGDVSTWSQFPATQNVDIAGFQLLDVGTINGLDNGGGLIWSVPGVSILGGSFGFQHNVGSSDTTEFRFGGVARVAFSNVGSSFSGGNMNLNSNNIVNVLDPTTAQDVATKAYVDAQVGGGGDFVTTNTFQSIPANKTWTGIQTFTGNSHSITSPNIFIGDSSSDNVFISADIATSLIPNSNNSKDLGSSGAQWRNLFIDGTAFIDILSMGGNIAMTGFKITNHALPTSSTDVATKAYVDSQTGGGGNFITLDTFQSVSASKTWNGSSHRFTNGLRVDSTIELNGTLNHDGSQLGFYGVSPTSRQTSNLAQLSSPIISTSNILTLAGAINGLIADLDDTGIIRAQ